MDKVFTGADTFEDQHSKADQFPAKRAVRAGNVDALSRPELIWDMLRILGSSHLDVVFLAAHPGGDDKRGIQDSADHLQAVHQTF